MSRFQTFVLLGATLQLLLAFVGAVAMVASREPVEEIVIGVSMMALPGLLALAGLGRSRLQRIARGVAIGINGLFCSRLGQGHWLPSFGALKARGIGR
jgi:hypothetical protein